MHADVIDRSPLGGQAREQPAGLPRRVHLLGAGGAGVSGAALLLRAGGVSISCSDRAESEHTGMLRSQGVPVEVGSQAGARLAEDVELVVRSAAVPTGDPQVCAALERGLPVLKYSELLARIAPAGRTLAVAGTHGKTSTAWLLYHALVGLLDARTAGPEASTGHNGAQPLPARPRPGALVGGICRGLEVNAVAPEHGGWFSVEACEYDRSFLRLSPRGAAITNVEADHLDYFGSLEAIQSAFARFADRIPPDGLLCCGPDVPRRIEAVSRASVWRLGRELRVQLLAERAGCFTFRLRGPDFHVPAIALPVPGRFQVDNAALALALTVGVAARAWGLDPDEAAACAAAGLERYPGCRRRFETWGEVGGITVVHDYAHHPTEVRVTLEAARRAFPGQALHVLFQPHQHSRTARFLHEFADSLRRADRVVVADVYGARVHVDGEHAAGAQELSGALSLAGVPAVAGGGLETSMECLVQGLPGEGMALILGAGDIGGIRHGLLERLALSGALRGGPRL